VAVSSTVIQRRIVLSAGLLVMGFALIGIRMVDVMALKGGDQAASADDSARPQVLRSDIVDRNGQLLARDLPVKHLYVRLGEVGNRAVAARELAAATDTDNVRLSREFSGKHNVVLVARFLPPEVQDRVDALGLGGIQFEPAEKRYHPQGAAAEQVLGSTDPDGRGVAGIEKGLDPLLRLGSSSVALSLDMRIQYALAHEVEEARREFSAKDGGGIVLDVRTGEILAMASLPDSQSDPATLYGEDPRANRMAAVRYELGSVFKIFSFALAVEDHTIRLDEPFQIGKGFKVGRFTIHEAERDMPTVLAARDVLALSSNSGTAQIALRSGADRQRQFLSRLGLLSTARTEISEARAPEYPDHWGQVETATIGFGHGIAVTPLAFVAAAAAVVNGGRRITPTFLKHPQDGRGEQLIKPETSATMRDLLRYVVTNGTGKKADVPGYDVGGKTGSAQRNSGGRYISHVLVTSFCGVFPIDDPRYLVFVLLDEPHGTKETGGWALAGYTAAPLAGKVIARIAPMLGMPSRAPVLPASKENT
jgi:cell division protein FtsI (penicillin-binding protein 3)